MTTNFDFISKYYPTLGHETATLVAVSCFTANNKPKLLSGLINKVILDQCVDMSATESTSPEYLKKIQLVNLIEKARETIFKNVFTIGLPLVSSMYSFFFFFFFFSTLIVPLSLPSGL
ncbi:hypothetical protein AYI70_g10804 [Smittium culicis]|uniref:Uncharacterized protein n=1 Tax=Smittium culicis TaxID=133412 RepID=A0A1R1X4U7_9FUNG|nr:hypothetical protein AYI70_g10804 [Smittium culicis]